MPEVTASPCDGISREIDALVAARADLEQHLAKGPPAEVTSMLVHELRRINFDLDRLHQQLHRCLEQHAPGPRPDLDARTVRLRVDHSTKEVAAAALIKNIGRGNAYGPFRIDLAATLHRGGVSTSFVQVFEVPAGVTIFAEPVLDPGEQAQLAASSSFSGSFLPMHPGGVFSSEYVTGDMVVPLFYRDESPSATYEFEFIVDSEQQVSESGESNNRFFARWWTTRPSAVLSTTPFEIDAKSGKVKEIK